MLPGMGAEAAGRQPLNPVSNSPVRKGGAAAAMQKLASEKAARKAKSSAAALLSQEARGAACITGRGGLDIKMPPLPPAPSGPQEAKPPTSARPAAHSYEVASAARQRVQQGQRASSSSMPTSVAGKKAGSKRGFSAVSADSAAGGGGATPRGSLNVERQGGAEQAFAATRAAWLSQNGGKHLLNGYKTLTPRGGGGDATDQWSGSSDISKAITSVSAAAAAQLQSTDRTGTGAKEPGGSEIAARGLGGGGGGGALCARLSLAGRSSVGGERGGRGPGGAATPRGGLDGGGDGGALGGLEKKLAKVTISALGAASDPHYRAKKRVRFNDDRLEETLKPKEGCLPLPSAYPLEMTGDTVGRAAGLPTRLAGSQMNPINPITLAPGNHFSTFNFGAGDTCDTAARLAASGMSATTAPDMALSVTGNGAAPRAAEGSTARLDVSSVQRALEQGGRSAVASEGRAGGSVTFSASDMQSLDQYRDAVHVAGPAGGAGGSEERGVRHRHHRHPPGPAPKGAPRRRTLEHGGAQQQRADTRGQGARGGGCSAGAYHFADPDHAAAHAQGRGEGGRAKVGGGGATPRKDMPCEEKNRGAGVTENKPFGFMAPTTNSNALSSAAGATTAGTPGAREGEGPGAGAGRHPQAGDGRQAGHRSGGLAASGASGPAPTKAAPTKTLSAGSLLSMGVPFGGGYMLSTSHAAAAAAPRDSAGTPREGGATPRGGTREKPLAMLARSGKKSTQRYRPSIADLPFSPKAH